jgi:hypothetical protein
MEQFEKTKEAVLTIGDLVESLYAEVSDLPLSETAKNALVMVMMGDLLKTRGRTIYFNYPAMGTSDEAAA